MNTLRNIAGVLLLSVIVTAQTSASTNLATEYREIGQRIIDMVNAQSIDVNVVQSHVLKLTKLSVSLAKQYSTKFPDGNELIDTVINQVALRNGNQVTDIGPMINLTFETIERDWHDLFILDSIDVGIDMEDEDNEHFTDPLHVMIHPIMVLRAAKDYTASRNGADLDKMKAEMAEGMLQVGLTAKRI